MSKRVDLRISEVERRLMAELATLDQRRTDIKNMLGTLQYVRNGGGEHVELEQPDGRRRPMSVAARNRIGAAQRKRWALAKRVERAQHARPRSSYKAKARPGNHNNALGPWTEKQDAVILNAIKLRGEPVEATEMARLLAGKLERTPGGVRQRIHRLAKTGVLKETGNGIGSRHTVEVA